MKNYQIISRRTLFVGLLLSVAASGASAWPHYNAKQRAGFRHAHPCPATLSTKGACAGYVIDHSVPRCAKGLDRAANMQWQAVGDAHRKDVEEAALCKAIRGKRAQPFTDSAAFCGALDRGRYPLIARAACGAP